MCWNKIAILTEEDFLVDTDIYFLNIPLVCSYDLYKDRKNSNDLVRLEICINSNNKLVE